MPEGRCKCNEIKKHIEDMCEGCISLCEAENNLLCQNIQKDYEFLEIH